VEKIIFDNVYIWKNLDTRIYQLANAFIMVCAINFPYFNSPSNPLFLTVCKSAESWHHPLGICGHPKTTDFDGIFYYLNSMAFPIMYIVILDNLPDGHLFDRDHPIPFGGQ
jgi:hypothetical protein